jgi:hypothetical protein
MARKSTSVVVYTTTSPGPTAAHLIPDFRVYVVCRLCGYEKVKGEPCGEPCV